MKSKNESTFPAVKHQKAGFRSQWEHLPLYTRVASHTGWLKKENKLFSAIVEEPVTNANVLRFYHAGIAFSVMALAASFNVITAIIGLIWFVTAVLDLKYNLKK